jgi:hypothetical protein
VLTFGRFFSEFEGVMTKLDERTTANMNVALENACRVLPNSGGDHETRKYIAKKLLQAANKGERTFGALEAVARRALQELSHRKSA